MLDTIASLFLQVTGEAFIIVTFLLGCRSNDRKVYLQALSLLLFTMVYNHWLKSLWQVPLPPTLGKEGWAFPSGHMHAAVVFYGYLLCHYFPLKKAVIPCCVSLVGVAWALVFKGYHYPADTVAAFAFGSLTICLTAFLWSREFFRNAPWRLSFLLLAIGLMLQRFFITNGFSQNHLLLADGALLGLCFSWARLKPLPVRIGIWQRYLPSLGALLLGIALRFALLGLPPLIPPTLVTFFQYFVLSTCLVLGPSYLSLQSQRSP